MSDASNNEAIAALDDLIERVSTLPKVVNAAMPEIAREWKRKLQATVAASTTPTGEPWADKKKGEGKPLVGAARDGTLGVAEVGNVIYVRLSGVEARHHRGAVRGKVARQIIPRGSTLPPAFRDIVIRMLRKHFHRHLALTNEAGNG